jgi:hypothetical protein
MRLKIPSDPRQHESMRRLSQFLILIRPDLIFRRTLNCFAVNLVDATREPQVARIYLSAHVRHPPQHWLHVKDVLLLLHTLSILRRDILRARTPDIVGEDER